MSAEALQGVAERVRSPDVDVHALFAEDLTAALSDAAAVETNAADLAQVLEARPGRAAGFPAPTCGLPDFAFHPDSAGRDGFPRGVRESWRTWHRGRAGVCGPRCRAGRVHEAAHCSHREGELTGTSAAMR